MKINKESYILPWRIGLIVYILQLGFFTNGQTVCPIWTASEPTVETSLSTSYYRAQHSQMQTISWQLSDSNTVNAIQLESYKVSNKLTFSNFGFNIPTGAIIQGVKVTVTGRSEGSGHIRDHEVKIGNEYTDSDNYAGKGYSALKIWKKGSVNQRWHYGREDDTWGMDWTAEDINSSEFNVTLQIRNILAGSIEGTIENIEVRVTYLPLVSFCASDCPIFYVDSIDNTTMYQWHIPSQFQLISKSDQFHIINLHVKPNTPAGIYEICVDAMDDGMVTSSCCRKFRFQVCLPGTVGDLVFEDRNRNGIQDFGETGVAQIPVFLYDVQDNLIDQTVSDLNGQYQFDNVFPGQYYIRALPGQNYEFSPPLAGNQDSDSNISGANGPGTSGLFTLDFDQNNRSIDVGLIGLAEISGVTWEDMNANGIRESGEPLLDGITVLLKDTSGNLIKETQTINGNYVFEQQYYGSYRLDFVFDSLYIPTVSLTGSPDTDSDLTNAFSTGVLLLESMGLSNIDGGVYRFGEIGDLLWYDGNCNGFLDINESGLEDIKILLYNNQDMIVANTFTSVEGSYQFTDIVPGSYYLQVISTDLTAVYLGDSKLQEINSQLISEQFTVLSGGVRSDIDLAVINRRADICGLAWFDETFNGIRESGEMFLEEIDVYLLDGSFDTLLQTATDENGAYCFSGLLPGNYMVQFQINDTQVISPPFEGQDTTVNSDIISDNGETMLFVLQSGKNILHVDAGLGYKAKISGEIWFEQQLNGLQDVSEPGLGDMVLHLFDAAGSLMSTTISDINGFYSFEFINPGDYYVEIEYPEIYKAVFDNGGDPLLNSEISDANGPNTTNLISINANDDISDFDFGLESNLGKICGLVWFDETYDGQRDVSEVLLEGMQVNLLDAQNNLIASQFSSSEGAYCFEELEPGIYTIQVVIDDYQLFSPEGMGPVTTDSDILSTSGMTLPFTVTYGADYQNVDAGIANKGLIGDLVWFDNLEINGLQDSGELDGFEGIRIYIYDTNNAVVDSTVSDANGGYIFEKLNPGDYYLEVRVPLGFKAALKGGIDPAIDSDITDANGLNTTDLISVFANSINFDIDFGIQNNAGQICGTAFQDLDADGIKTGNDGLVNQPILLELYNDNDSLIAVRNTNIIGSFCFDVSVEGTYYLQAKYGEDLQLTIQDAGMDDTVDNDFDKTGRTELITINFGDVLTLDPGFTFTSTIGDYVWLDENHDGLQTLGENGIAGIEINLLDDTGNTIETVVSGPGGFYQFVNIKEGIYQLSFLQPDSLEFTIPFADPFLGSFADATGNTPLFNVFPNTNDPDKDAGLIIPLGSIKGVAFLDVDNDNQRGIDDMLIPGLVVNLLDGTGQLIGSTVTGNMGEYSFEDLDEGEYIVQFDTTYGAPFVTPFVGNSDTDSDVTETLVPGGTEKLNVINNQSLVNIDAGYSGVMGVVKGNTWEDLFADGILDSLDRVIDSVQVYLYTMDSTLVDSTLSDENGEYVFEVQNEGLFFVTFDLPDTCFIITAPYQGSNELIDSDVTGDFLEYSTDTFYVGQNNMVCGLNAGYIGFSTIQGVSFIDENLDNIRQNGEQGINGIKVVLINDQGNPMDTVMTFTVNGVEGAYLFENILPGDYTIQYQRPLFYFPVDPNIGNDTFDSDFIMVDDLIAQTSTFQITSKSKVDFVDFGLFFMQEFQSRIYGSIWRDENINGLNEGGEPFISNVQVNLYDENEDLIATENSDDSGNFSFEMLTEGFYYIEALISPDSVATLYRIGADPTIDNDFILSGNKIRTEQFFLSNFMDTTHLDLGIVGAVNIGDFVWEDLDFDGTQDSDEPGLSGVNILLLDNSGAVVSSTLSDANGNYAFDRMLSDIYQVQIVVPDSMSVTKQDAGADDIDNDFDQDGYTALIDFTNLSNVLDIDAGLVKNGCIGDRVWVDFNGNGAQNVAEPGQSGVMVRLYDSMGNLIAEDSTKTTSVDEAFYKFDNIPPGDYYAVFDTLPGYMFTTPDNAIDSIDSDVTSSIVFGSTDIFPLLPGEFKRDIDAGVFLPGKLGDFLWEDQNENGIQDAGEPGIANAEVKLLMPSGLLAQSTMTNADGIYCFTGLKQGLYRVEFPMIPGMEITVMDASANDMEDSDADPANGRTPLISLAHGATFLGLDCGYLMTRFNEGKEIAFDRDITTLMPSPNPAVFETWLDVEEDGVYEIYIMNSLGQIARQLQQDVNNGRLSIDVKELETGSYYFYMVSPTNRKFQGSFIRVF